MLVSSGRTSIKRRLLMILVILAVAPLTCAHGKRCKRFLEENAAELSLVGSMWQMDLSQGNNADEWSVHALHLQQEQVYGNTRLLEGYVIWRRGDHVTDREFVEGSVDGSNGNLELKGIYFEHHRDRINSQYSATICRDMKRMARGTWHHNGLSQGRWTASRHDPDEGSQLR